MNINVTHQDKIVVQVNRYTDLDAFATSSSSVVELDSRRLYLEKLQYKRTANKARLINSPCELRRVEGTQKMKNVNSTSCVFRWTIHEGYSSPLTSPFSHPILEQDPTRSGLDRCPNRLQTRTIALEEQY